jgi:hypothetical protein
LDFTAKLADKAKEMRRKFLLLIAFFLASSVSAHAQTHVPSGSSCLMHALDESIPVDHLLGNGSSATSDAVLTQWENHPAVYLKTKGVDAAVLKRLQQKTFNQMTRMNLTDAHQFLEALARKRESFYKIPFEQRARNGSTMFHLSPEETALDSVANTVVNFEQLKNASHLSFEGKPILPEPLALVKNADKIPVGTLIEYIPGNTLQAAAFEKPLNDEQLREIFRQLTGQLKVLHANGFIHGDLHAENIMLDLAEPSAPKVRLIDMTYAVKSADTTPEHDWEELADIAYRLGYREYRQVH